MGGTEARGSAYRHNQVLLRQKGIYWLGERSRLAETLPALSRWGIEGAWPLWSIGAEGQSKAVRKGIYINALRLPVKTALSRLR